jgi:hypothetical protein
VVDLAVAVAQHGTVRRRAGRAGLGRLRGAVTTGAAPAGL